MRVKAGVWHSTLWKKTYCFQGEKEIPENPNPVVYWLRILLSPFLALLWFIEVCIIVPISYPFESCRVQKILKILYWSAFVVIFILAFLKS